MRVLVIGSGAREHALTRSLAADPGVDGLWVAPGNPGIAGERGVDGCPPVVVDDGADVASLARRLAADVVVIGPEIPLVAGVADAVRAAGIACFGPSAAAAELEGSKAFAKDVMAAAGVPTAAAAVCTTEEDVENALATFGAPYVVKDDALAAGKGVVVTDDASLALAHARTALARPGGTVVVEDYLDGPEVSLFCVCDGSAVVALEPAQDFKRAFDGDAGPNTGGMGAYSPLPWAPPDLAEEVLEHVARPVVAEMARRGAPFTGLLYCGLALTSTGVRVVEFNVRFGDPETQVVLARLRSPLGGLLHAAATGTLAKFLHARGGLSWSEDAAVTVVVAASGYPGAARSGDVLDGLGAAAGAGAAVLHAGTGLDTAGRLVSTGGRVLSVVATGPSLSDARRVAYEAVDRVHLDGSHHRRDIAAAVSS